MSKLDKAVSTINHLVDAIKTVQLAKNATGNGLVDDHCCNALMELYRAFGMAIDDVSQEQQEMIEEAKKHHY